MALGGPENHLGPKFGVRISSTFSVLRPKLEFGLLMYLYENSRSTDRSNYPNAYPKFVRNSKNILLSNQLSKTNFFLLDHSLAAEYEANQIATTKTLELFTAIIVLKPLP